MNKRAIVYVLGAVLLIGAALMLPPLLVALIYHEVSGWYFLWVMLGAAVLGALALRLGGWAHFNYRKSYADGDAQLDRPSVFGADLDYERTKGLATT